MNHFKKIIFSLTATTFITVLAHAQTPLIYENMTPEIKLQIQGDLKLAADMTFSKTSALHQKIFGKQSTYLAWFKKRIKTVMIGRCMTNDAAVACVIPILEQNNMRVTQHYVEMNAPQIARMSVLFHEARHTEENPILKAGDPDLRYWMHAKCPSPFLDEKGQERMSIWTGLPLSGVDGCDSTAEGSYGSVVVMLKNISLYSTNTTEKLKADAELYSADQLTRIIDPSAHDLIVNDQ